MKRLVVLGTGTGVGKTHVGARMVQGWRERGHPAWGLKPIESGLGDGAQPSDAERLQALGQSSPGGLHLNALPDPVSPHLAARRVGLTISLEEVVAWVNEAETYQKAIHDNAPDAMSLVETAGGAWTPLSSTATCVHLAEALRPARLMLVAPDALGVLHDVAATLIALGSIGGTVDFLVLSESRPRDASTGTNAAELEQVVFPRLGGAAPRLRRVFRLPAGGTDVSELLDAWAALD